VEKVAVSKPPFRCWEVNWAKHDIRSPNNSQIRRGSARIGVRCLTLTGLDSLLISWAWLVAVAFGTPLMSPWTQEQGMHLLLPILAIEIVVISANGLYACGKARRHYGRLFSAMTFACLLLLLIAFLHDPNQYVSRSTFLLFWFLSYFFVALGRFSFDAIVNGARNHGAIRHSTFLVCSADEREKSAGLIQSCNYYNILGIADSNVLDVKNRESVFAELKALNVEEVFVSWSAIKNRLHLCWHFRSSGITLRVLPAQDQFLPSQFQFSYAEDIHCLRLSAPIVTGVPFWTKRCLDLGGAVLLIVLMLPVYLLIALCIRLDSPGPIFFRQTRVGLHSREFKVWKFRTMVTDAGKLQAELEAKNEVKDGVLFKMKDDPRITRVGRFLRSYSLDELPQLFNVLLGHMSLVGPRPLPVRDVQRFKECHFIRQEVLPGITGLWQVSGRSNIASFDDSVALDFAYIENWSLWLDLKIMLKTVQVVLQKTGAY